MTDEELYHYGIKGQKWGVRRFQNKDGTYTAEGKSRRNKQDDEYDEERERHEQEVAARRGEKYVRKTKKEREKEDAENEKKEQERRVKEDAAYKRTEDKMKAIDKKLQSKYDFNKEGDVDKYYEEYDKEWFKILYEERKKEGLSHADMSPDELYHYGVKGQKWGRRRYQYEDGSLTPAGRERYGNKENFEKQYPTDAKNADLKLLGETKKATSSARELNRNISEFEKSKSRRKQEKVNKIIEEAARDNARKMTDQELREAVNRLNMEENYTRMVSNRERIQVGESKASIFMDKAATTLLLTEAALSIALIVRQLKK